MASVALTVSAWAIDYAVTAILRHLAGIDPSGIGEFSIWLVAVTIVWLPLSIGFYLRSRGEMTNEPWRRSTPLHKVVISLFYFVNTLFAVVASFVMVYTLIQFALGASDDSSSLGELLVGTTLPAALAALLHVGLMFGFSENRTLGRKRFAMIFGGIGAAVTLLLFILAFGVVRDQNIDQKTERDVKSINSAIRDYYMDNRSLPSELSDLDTRDVTQDLSRYEYRKINSSRYQICAEFLTDTNGDREWLPDQDSDYAANYIAASSHDAGRHCFKAKAPYATPLKY